MIDWLKMEFSCFHDRINNGKLLSINPDGSTDWEIEKRVKVRGSYESNIHVRSESETKEAREQGRAQWLIIDGNPAKWLQGHNIDGTEDVIQLGLMTYDKLCHIHPNYYDDLTRRRIQKGDFSIYRIDINRMFDLESDLNVEQWLHAAEFRCHGRSGRATSSKGTVYLQKGSTRYSISFYNKYREITKGGKKHNLIDSDDFDKDRLIDYSKGKLRAEVRILKKELIKRKLTKASDLNNEIDNLYTDYMGRIEMNAQAELLDNELLNLPKSAMNAYQLWKTGHDVKSLYSKAQFYKLRKVLKEFDIDISLQPVAITQSNVVPLLRVLEAQPVTRPEWLNQYVINENS